MEKKVESGKLFRPKKVKEFLFLFLFSPQKYFPSFCRFTDWDSLGSDYLDHITKKKKKTRDLLGNFQLI